MPKNALCKKEEIIKVELNEQLEPIVSGRELHQELGIKTEYTKWFSRMVEYGFVENQDFALVSQKCQTNNPKNPVTTITDHAMKLDMAKEIAMIQRNEKGRQVRQYFIQVEKDFNSPEKIMARALKIAEHQISALQTKNAQQQQIIGELKPKATYYDLVLQNKSLIPISIIAKDYGMGAPTLNKKLYELGVQYKTRGNNGIWLLYKEHQAKGYTSSKTQEYVDKDGKSQSKLHTYWTQKGRLFIYDLLKQHGILPLIEIEEQKGEYYGTNNRQKILN